MYNVYATYITAFRLLQCKAIFSRGAYTHQRPFSENVHLPKVGTVKSVSKSVSQHYSAAAPFSNDRQLNRFGQLLPRNDATRRPEPIPYKLITPNQTRLRKVVSRHCGGARPPYYIAVLYRPIGNARLEFPIVIVLTNSLRPPLFLREDVSCSSAKTLASLQQVHSARVGKTKRVMPKSWVFQEEKIYTSAKKPTDCSVFQPTSDVEVYSEKSGETLLFTPKSMNWQCCKLYIILYCVLCYYYYLLL